MHIFTLILLYFESNIKVEHNISIWFLLLLRAGQARENRKKLTILQIPQEISCEILNKFVNRCKKNHIKSFFSFQDIAV